MLLRLLEERYPLDAVVFYDTGMEFDAIYNIIEKVKPLLKDYGVEFVELYPEKLFLYSMLEQKIKYRKKEGFHYGFGWCGGPCRWATSIKTNTIAQYKKSIGDEVVDYVGIAADEQHRFDTQKRQVGKRMPLVEWGMTEADCLQYCHDRGFYWIERSTAAVSGYVDLYDILDRVSCWCCANKNLKELKNIYLYLPQYWERLRELQTHIVRPYKGYYKGQPKGIFELEKRFEKEEEVKSWE